MQSASSVNHTGEGNRLCNEILFCFLFFQRLLAFRVFFLSFDELRYCQRKSLHQTHSPRCSPPSEVKGNRFEFLWNSIRHNFQSTTLLITARGRDVWTMWLCSDGGICRSWKERNVLCGRRVSRGPRWRPCSISLRVMERLYRPALCFSWKARHYYES